MLAILNSLGWGGGAIALTAVVFTALALAVIATEAEP